MKRLFLVGLAITLSACSDWQASKLVNPESKGTIINGFEVGKCYTIKSDDPFGEEDVRLIVDGKGKYIKYSWWLGTTFGYGKPFSRMATYREHHEEVPCP